MVGGGYVLTIYTYGGRENIERIGRGGSKRGMRLIVLGAIVFTIVCMVRSI